MMVFECTRNQDVEYFLKNKAINFEKRSTSRTYLILDEDGQILSYFSLSFKEVTLNTEKVSGTSIKKLDGFSKTATTVKAYLIGQIGKNSQIQDNPIRLENIFNEIYNVIAQAQSLIGGRVVILECEDNEKLIALYERHGYKILEIIQVDTLKTMYISISDAI